MTLRDTTPRNADHPPQEQRKLEEALADAQLLQEISTELIHQDAPDALYRKILEAAVGIMRSDCASMQVLEPNDGHGVLRLTASSGFSMRAQEALSLVTVESRSTCGEVLRTGERVIVPDVERCEFMRGTPDLEILRQASVRAAQSTPLRSRDGSLLGVMSTHWHAPHSPSDRALGLLDTLARQAADLIERTHAEAALRRREAELRFRSLQFETLVDQAPLGVYLVDADFRVQQINPIARPAFAGIAGGALGRDLRDVLHLAWPRDRAEELVRIFRHTLQTGESYVEHERAQARADGGPVEYYEWRVDRIALPDGRFGAVCYFRDVSEQVRARLDVAESEERYRSLFLSIDEGFCIFDMHFDAVGRPVDWTFIETNPAFEKHTGLRNAVGKRIRELTPEIEDHWLEVHGRVSMTGEPARIVLRAHSLDDRWFDVSAFRLGGPRSRRVAMLFKDATERKRAETALKQADRRKDEFLATLAHELRNPLGAIRLAVNVIKNSEHDPKRLADMSAIMERQSSQLVRLIDDLLDISRIARGKVELRPQPSELSTIISQAVEAVRSMYDSKDQLLSLTLPHQPVLVRADPLRLAQVITNLLGNAHKFTQRGGTIQVIAEREGEWGIIRVRDPGIGIPPDQLERIFDMFEQVEGAEPPSPGGLGIGLSLARSLVELHGGSIQAYSEGRGKGSEFVVRIPASVAERAHGELAAEGDARRIGPAHRIIAVDDNFDALEAVGVMLRMRGHEVEMAESGEQALELARTGSSRIMLLDIGMPGMDGYEVARQIREQPWGKDMFLIAITGWGQEKDKLRAREAGFDAHLTKPVDPQVLERLLAAVDPQGRDRRWR